MKDLNQKLVEVIAELIGAENHHYYFIEKVDGLHTRYDEPELRHVLWALSLKLESHVNLVVIGWEAQFQLANPNLYRGVDPLWQLQKSLFNQEDSVKQFLLKLLTQIK